VLDEPTSALDILGARSLLDFLETLRGESRAILLSTHRLHETERRCDRFVVIHAGRVVAEGTRDVLVDGRSGGLEEAFFAAVDAAGHDTSGAAS
jgi:ABC-type Na+ transport system ATPase subunit NatA